MWELLLFAYAFVSNVAVALIPHEPGVIWWGAHHGVWATALWATAGTLAACWVDQRHLVPLLARRLPLPEDGAVGWAVRAFARAPLAVVALSGLTPLPFWPLKLLAHAADLPLWRYLLAVALGRLPRYLLLAWIGQTAPFPGWLISLICLVVLVAALWRRRGGQPQELDDDRQEQRSLS